MSILEWDGYQAFGTPTNKKAGGLSAGEEYTKKFGANGITYSLIVNDSEALNKVRSGQQFDIIHPCIENLQDYVNDGLVQPWDTSLLPSFANLNPALVRGGQLNGQQYFIPWDWGYGSVIYRTDKVDPADAKGWELFWNPKYKDRISMWNGNTTNFEIAALKLGYGGKAMDHLTDDQLTNAKNTLIEQYPLNKFLWSSEYTDLQPALQNGDIWIAYSWQDQWVYAKAKGIPMAYMQPSQGRLGWYCGFMLGKDTQELLPRPRLRRVLHQPQVVPQPDQLLLLRQRRRHGQAQRDLRPGGRQVAGHRQPERARVGERPPAELGAERGGGAAGMGRGDRVRRLSRQPAGKRWA